MNLTLLTENIFFTTIYAFYQTHHKQKTSTSQWRDINSINSIVKHTSLKKGCYDTYS